MCNSLALLRNFTSTTFLQQILSDKFLLVVIEGKKSNFSISSRLEPVTTCHKGFVVKFLWKNVMDVALLGSFWESPNGKKVCFSNFLLLNIWIINCCILSNWLGLLICIQTELNLCYTSTMYQRQLKSQEEKRIKGDKATKNTFLKYILWVFLLGDYIYIYIKNRAHQSSMRGFCA